MILVTSNAAPFANKISQYSTSYIPAWIAISSVLFYSAICQPFNNLEISKIAESADSLLNNLILRFESFRDLSYVIFSTVSNCYIYAA
jgi:hypothetical protein